MKVRLATLLLMIASTLLGVVSIAYYVLMQTSIFQERLDMIAQYAVLIYGGLNLFMKLYLAIRIFKKLRGSAWIRVFDIVVSILVVLNSIQLIVTARYIHFNNGLREPLLQLLLR